MADAPNDEASQFADLDKRGGMICSVCKQPIVYPSMTRPYLCDSVACQEKN